MKEPFGIVPITVQCALSEAVMMDNIADDARTVVRIARTVVRIVRTVVRIARTVVCDVRTVFYEIYTEEILRLTDSSREYLIKCVNHKSYSKNIF